MSTQAFPLHLTFQINQDKRSFANGIIHLLNVACVRHTAILLAFEW